MTKDSSDQAPCSTGPRRVVLTGASSGIGAETCRAFLSAGYEVIAVQTPLTSLADDVATTRRVLALRGKRGKEIAVDLEA